MAVLAAALGSAPGCLVLNLHPSYDEDSITWDPGLVGSWRDAEDNVSLTVAADEWKSYRIHYVHPIESGDLTGYLTVLADERYVDVTPVRGKDPGSFLVPVHAVLHVRLDGDILEVTPLSYDWLADRLKSRRPPPGLEYVLDQKQNALVISPAAAFRAWLRRQPAGGATFGARAVFTRVKNER